MTQFFSGAAPVTDSVKSSDLITYLKNGGSFYIPAEAAALLIAAALIAFAAVLFFISSKYKKENDVK